MKNIIYIMLAAILLSGSLMSLDDEYHRPYFKDEVLKTIEAQLQAYERCLATELKESACEGMLAPWFGTFGLGAYLGAKDAQGGLKDKMGQGFAGGIISTICLSPISILLSLPLALVSMSYTTVRYLMDGVKTLQREDEFEREMARHLFQWMELVKRGRLAIRAELKVIEWAAQAKNQTFSLSNATSELLCDNSFDKYFGSISWNRASLKELLSHLDEAQNSWEHFFHTVSWRMRIPQFTEQQWATLDKRLRAQISDEGDFAAVSDADIEEYLYCAIYFFTVANPKHLKMLEHYVK